jgi:hypothetical protein
MSWARRVSRLGSCQETVGELADGVYIEADEIAIIVEAVDGRSPDTLRVVDGLEVGVLINPVVGRVTL